MDWRCGSNGKAPALQAQSPAFKPKLLFLIILKRRLRLLEAEQLS
jgi:hypothetical protein